MINDAILAFIIGSSYVVTLPFFLRVMNVKNKNYSYRSYTVIAPIYMGLMNMFALYLRNRYNLSLEKSLGVTSLISSILIILWATASKAYSNQNIVIYSIEIFIRHFITFNVLIYILYKIV